MLCNSFSIGLGMEARALCLLGRSFINELQPSPLSWDDNLCWGGRGECVPVSLHTVEVRRQLSRISFLFPLVEAGSLCSPFLDSWPVSFQQFCFRSAGTTDAWHHILLLYVGSGDLLSASDL